MKLYETKELRKLSAVADYRVAVFGERLINAIINDEIINDNTLNYGCKVEEAINPNTPVEKVANALRKAGITKPTSAHFELLMQCVVVGDHDCPECGGEMEVIEERTRRVAGDGYITPYEYEPVWQRKRCPICGEIIEIEY